MSGLRVEVTSGVDAGASAQVPAGGRLVVGRGGGAGLRLTDPAVGLEHLAIERGLGGARLVDLGAQPGCTLDGDLLGSRESRRLQGGQQVTLGETTLRVSVEGQGTLEIPGIRLLARLGEGASGTVYEARRADGRAVAVKVLAEDADETEARRLLRAAELSRSVSHRALARVLGVERVGRRLALVRELVAGETLAERVQRGGPLDWREACALGAELAGGLAHAHQRGVVHRDVKPGNVVVQPDGQPKLIDLGLGRLTSGSGRVPLTRLTASREGLGTLLFVAPEQLDDAHRADGRADVYGLGLTLYAALAGREPFRDVEPEDFLAALRQHGPRPLSELRPQLPRAFTALLARAYAPRAEDRPDAAGLRHALKLLLAAG